MKPKLVFYVLGTIAILYVTVMGLVLANLFWNPSARVGKFGNILIKTINTESVQSTKNGVCLINVKDQTWFKWDRMVVYEKDSHNKDVEEVLGFSHKYIEFAPGIIFLLNNKIVYEEKLPYDVDKPVKLSINAGDNKCRSFTPDEAVFLGFENRENKDLRYYVRPVRLSENEITDDQLILYMITKRSDMFKTFGKQEFDGYTEIMKTGSHLPYMFIKGLGLTFAFPNRSDDFPPAYIIVEKQSNVRNINYKKAEPGMDFDQIAKMIFDQIKVTYWPKNSLTPIYEVSYNSSVLNYSFVSSDITGKDSKLYISLNSR